mmetsp:Transcript_49472/g.41772  ORF Transcript_49472/g.41772 Transcript_49472/m.41772 type:complete len:388 (-) Transcript_49472:3622-4785(-)
MRVHAVRYVCDKINVYLLGHIHELLVGLDLGDVALLEGATRHHALGGAVHLKRLSHHDRLLNIGNEGLIEVDGDAASHVEVLFPGSRQLHHHLDLVGANGNGEIRRQTVVILGVVLNHLDTLGTSGLNRLGVGSACSQLVASAVPDHHGLERLLHTERTQAHLRQHDIQQVANLRHLHVGGLQSAQVGAMHVLVEARHLARRGHLHAQRGVSAWQTLERELRHLYAYERQLLLLVALLDSRGGAGIDHSPGGEVGEVDVEHLGGEGHRARGAHVGLNHLELVSSSVEHLHVEGARDFKFFRDPEDDVLETREGLGLDIGGRQHERRVARVHSTLLNVFRDGKGDDDALIRHSVNVNLLGALHKLGDNDGCIIRHLHREVKEALELAL